jgi:hypothetical protein
MGSAGMNYMGAMNQYNTMQSMFPQYGGGGATANPMMNNNINPWQRSMLQGNANNAIIPNMFNNNG